MLEAYIKMTRFTSSYQLKLLGQLEMQLKGVVLISKSISLELETQREDNKMPQKGAKHKGVVMGIVFRNSVS